MSIRGSTTAHLGGVIGGRRILAMTAAAAVIVIPFRGEELVSLGDIEDAR